MIDPQGKVGPERAEQAEHVMQKIGQRGRHTSRSDQRLPFAPGQRITVQYPVADIPPTRENESDAVDNQPGTDNLFPVAGF